MKTLTAARQGFSKDQVAQVRQAEDIAHQAIMRRQRHGVQIGGGHGEQRP